MNTFSFRAECSADIDELKLLLTDFDVAYIMHSNESPHPFNHHVQLRADCDWTEMQQIVRLIPDGHVVLQTLRQCELKDNSLERD